MRALNLLRDALVYRKDVFSAGLRAAGYKIVSQLHDPRPDDLLLIWNRYTHFDAEARRFERANATVVVAENGFVREGIVGKWFALARNHHSGAGHWNTAGPERWDSLSVRLHPWRTDGNELVLLGQRGIGEDGIAAPRGWAESLQKTLGGRVRHHPGNEAAKIPLEEDLKNAFAVVTWSSAAALYALIWGIPVIAAWDRWIGAGACLPLSAWVGTVGSQKRAGGPILAVPDVLKRSDADRLAMFRRLAWAMWELREIQSGAAFRHLLSHG